MKAALRSLSRFLSSLLDRLRPSETTVLILLAVVVGAVTGLAAIFFVHCILWVTTLGYRGLPGIPGLPDLGRWWVVIVPVLGGAIGGPIIARFAREAKGHGVPEVMQAIALNRGVIRPRVALAKIAASSLCIGTGGSAGREGPIVQVGATLGSTLGQLLRLSEERVRNLVACGAAAGVAATFNAPIAGVAFAIEVLSGDLGLGLLGNVVISAVTASVVSQAVLESGHAFEVPVHALNSPVEILFYVVLGVAAALVGVAFIRVLYSAEDLFDNWRRVPQWIKPAIGGLALGLLGYIYPLILSGPVGMTAEQAHSGLPVAVNLPHVFGSGFESIDGALRDPGPWTLLVALVVLKMLATALTLGSGNSGGVFAPSLFMGAMLGGAFGLGAQALYPEIAVSPGAYALAGMAAVFSAAARAPLTAILIAFEMSHDYGVILPLMATTITATIVASRLHPESIYSLKLVRRGVRLKMGRDIDVLDHVLVRDVMDPKPALISPAMALKDLESFFISHHRHGAVVVDDEGRLVGVATLQDLARAKLDEGWEDANVSDIMIKTLLTAHPDETMGAAMQRMAVRDVGRLPVVDRSDPTLLLGVIRRTDLARAYQRGLLGRQELRDRHSQQRAVRGTGTELLELSVERGSPVQGQRIRDLELPEGVLLTTRRRDDGQQLLHGKDILDSGDVVRAIVEPDAVDAVCALFRTRPDEGQGGGDGAEG